MSKNVNDMFWVISNTSEHENVSNGWCLGGWEALPRKESLLLVFGNHDYQVMCFFPQGKIDVGEGNHNWWNQTR